MLTWSHLCRAGWNNSDPLIAGSFLDKHDYAPDGPTAFPKSTTLDIRINSIGEMGGIGFPIYGHLYNPSLLYSPNMFSTHFSPGPWLANYAEMVTVMQLQVANASYGLSAAVFTELADVGFDITGLTTYDRQILKVNVTAIFEANQALYAAMPGPARA